MKTTSFKITANDGMTLQTEFTKDETQPVKGTVIIVHGFGEHIGGYRELAKILASAGYASILFDQRGHGDLSAYGNISKLQGIIPAYQAFLDDIDIMIAKAKELQPDAPIALYGHSMGGNISLNYLLKQSKGGIKCLVLESPWLGLYKELNVVVDRIAKILGALSPKIAIYNKLDPEVLTGDAEQNADYDDDPFYHNRISLRMYSGVKKGCAFALANASKLTLPIYLANGKNDIVVSNNAINEFAKLSGDNLISKEYDAFHAIRKGIRKEEFFSDILDYLEKYLK